MRVPRLASAVALWAGAAWLLAPSARADDYSNRFGFTLGGGAYKLVGGAKDHAKVGPWAETGLRWGWRRHWDLEGTYRYGSNWDDTQNFRTTTTGLDVGVLWSLHPDSRFTPQVFGGSGVFWWNVDDFRGVASPGMFDSGRQAMGFREGDTDEPDGAALNGNNVKVYGGIGAEWFLTTRLSLRGVARIDYLVSQKIDNTGASDSLGAAADPTGQVLAKAKANVDANDWVPAVAAQITYFFGDRDADQDGVPNTSDGCPYDPEDRDGFEDADGCPDPDNDKDGVLDTQDKCPGEAEDKDAFQDEDGCPDADNDKDGVGDAEDKCPDQAEDKDAFQDEDGCPDLDNDGDAVADSLDQCPDTPRGTRVDNRGCPIAATPQEVQLVETGMFELRGLHFASGKAEIQPEDYPALDQVVEILKRWPTARIEIGGHTDAQGSEAKNQELSAQRSRAVLDYLVAKAPDIDAGRLSSAGYGESRPVADNATEAGRSRNRRVEFKLLNRDEIQQEIERRTTPAPPKE
jgi:outer membrane protein OmpA-like peptidoglycan-associated protein